MGIESKPAAVSEAFGGIELMKRELYRNIVREIEERQPWGEPTRIAGFQWDPHLTPMEVFQATTYEQMVAFLQERDIDLQNLLPGYSGDVRAALAAVCG